MKFNDGYRVMSINGHLLSLKPLTYDNAVKQIKAVSINEGLYKDKVKGGSEPLNQTQKNKKFYEQLRKINYEPLKYLEDAKERAKKEGYNPDNLFISDKSTHKLMMKDDNNKFQYFGKPEYGDYLIWKHSEKNNLVPKGYADKKRDIYHKSHSKIKGDWVNNKFSPNMLSLKINW
jgi:hypothetical protein